MRYAIIITLTLLLFNRKIAADNLFFNSPFDVHKNRITSQLDVPNVSDLSPHEGDFFKNYIGLIPSLLVEPYDTINALEVNTFPFLFAIRFGNQHHFSLQIRPIFNYRFYRSQSGYSQIGGTIVVNKFFPNPFENINWLNPQLGTFITYTYNRLDNIQTLTIGLEPGAYMMVSPRWSMSVNLQPGINYYPNQLSRDFVKAGSGFKGHFGIIFHLGYNFR
tara:strand:- start:315 stop:971 length:657 start_codon:yes stop_codon:yes gene_type:complete